MNKFLTHWKTTAAGILSAFLGTVGPASSALAAYDALIQQVPGHSHADFRVAIAGIVLTAAAAIARGWIGLLMHDSPAQPVTVPQLKAVGIEVPAIPPAPQEK